MQSHSYFHFEVISITIQLESNFCSVEQTLQKSVKCVEQSIGANNEDIGGHCLRHSDIAYNLAVLRRFWKHLLLGVYHCDLRREERQ